MTTESNNTGSESEGLEKLEGIDPGAAFPFPSADLIWVQHRIVTVGGEFGMRCRVCGWEIATGTACPGDARDVMEVDLYVSGKGVQQKMPRARFVVPCRPWFGSLPDGPQEGSAPGTSPTVEGRAL